MPSIVIHPHRATWASDFTSIREHLIGILGQRALDVAHIGSTSVPGLGAKDIIDIQVGVVSLNAELTFALQAAGYEYVAMHSQDHIPAGEDGPELNWSKLYFRQRPSHRPCHIHVRIHGNPNHRYALLFRDYLRAHAEARMTVELVKRELARLHADDEDAYYAVKDPVYDLVWQAARAWAAGTGWCVERVTAA